MILRDCTIPTPVGVLRFALRGDAVCAGVFDDAWPDALRGLEKRFGEVELRSERDPARVVTKLIAYLAGDLDVIQSIATDTAGTPFQERVWAALRAIPSGQTTSYGALGKSIGVPSGASRAIGGANHNNPVILIVPCHRVIGASGALTGYGGGIERKAWLLAHEGALLRPSAAMPLTSPAT
jgi:methylated-DNA-[protein]-cysteine S-methyltransferase